VVPTVDLAVEHMECQVLVQEIHHQYHLLKVMMEEHKVLKVKVQVVVQQEQVVMVPHPKLVQEALEQLLQ
jgi:hypothetical protein